jgi:hypothetical protein
MPVILIVILLVLLLGGRRLLRSQGWLGDTPLRRTAGTHSLDSGRALADGQPRRRKAYQVAPLQ